MSESIKLKDLLSFVVDNRGKTPPCSDEGIHELIEVNAIAQAQKYPQYDLVRKKVDDEIYNNWFRKGHPKKDDILIPTVGTLDAISMMKENRGCIAQNMIALRTNQNLCFSEYLYYFMCDKKFRAALLNLDIGGVQPSLKVPHLMDMQINLPPLPEQNAIANTLSILDRNIELNNQANQVLEEMAQAIFDKYSSESNNEVAFSSLVDICGGGTPKTTESTYWNGSIPFFTPKDVSGVYTLTTDKYVTEDGLKHCNSKLYSVGTVFITARGTVGKIAIAGEDMAMNQSCYALIGKEIEQSLVFFYTRHIVSQLRHQANGAVFDAITTKDFDKHLVPVFSETIQDELTHIFSPIFKLILTNYKENQTLTQIRNTLLPKLMSGEVRVPVGEVE